MFETINSAYCSYMACVGCAWGSPNNYVLLLLYRVAGLVLQTDSVEVRNGERQDGTACDFGRLNNDLFTISMLAQNTAVWYSVFPTKSWPRRRRCPWLWTITTIRFESKRRALIPFLFLGLKQQKGSAPPKLNGAEMVRRDDRIEGSHSFLSAWSTSSVVLCKVLLLSLVLETDDTLDCQVCMLVCSACCCVC